MPEDSASLGASSVNSSISSEGKDASSTSSWSTDCAADRGGGGCCCGDSSNSTISITISPVANNVVAINVCGSGTPWFGESSSVSAGCVGDTLGGEGEDARITNFVSSICQTGG